MLIGGVIMTYNESAKKASIAYAKKKTGKSADTDNDDAIADEGDAE